MSSVERVEWQDIEDGEALATAFDITWDAGGFGRFMGTRIVKVAGGFATRKMRAAVVLKALERLASEGRG